MSKFHDTIRTWAQAQVEVQKFVDEAIPNTPERVLAQLLHDNFCGSIDDRTGWECACDWVLSGVKGYLEKSLDELIDDVNDEIVQNVSHSWLGLPDDHYDSGEHKAAVFMAYVKKCEEGDDDDEDVVIMEPAPQPAQYSSALDWLKKHNIHPLISDRPEEVHLFDDHGRDLTDAFMDYYGFVFTAFQIDKRNDDLENGYHSGDVTIHMANEVIYWVEDSWH